MSRLDFVQTIRRSIIVGMAVCFPDYHMIKAMQCEQVSEEGWWGSPGGKATNSRFLSLPGFLIGSLVGLNSEFKDILNLQRKTDRTKWYSLACFFVFRD